MDGNDEQGGVEFEPARAMAELAAKIESEPSADRPAEVRLEDLGRRSELFQPRGGIDEHHVGVLAKAIRSGGKPLEPIEVLQAGPELIIIDGHHRFDAYKEAKWSDAVPVSYFEGTLEEAVIASGRANSRAKLVMRQPERLNYAWRLTLLERLSKAQIADASGVGTSTVANMRTAKNKLEDRAFEFNSWGQAQRAANETDEDMSDDQLEQWKEQLADRWAEDLSRKFGPKMVNLPEIAAMALERYFGRRLSDVAEELLGHLSDDQLDAILEEQADRHNPDF
ncbi:ParB/RepB/Spo0J family partition protein [Fulvimarina sp. 2208YS6-2-32]|uniref:ParB/RepB/Spo0J family partition protein n=2 Tax=Fulvimarina uroteuthidis TaxID=3098149 RepID=A0ABU5I238_9HYPH|nr:ParB/RepB/Spo0J family partition protein [Fulvimarina sp. 2208YS6-2-32]